MPTGVVNGIFNYVAIRVVWRRNFVVSIKASMSALPPKADIREGAAECPLMTQSGHLPNEINTQHRGMIAKKSPAEEGPVVTVMSTLDN